MHTLDKRSLHTLDLLDGGEGGTRCLDSEAVERVRVVTHGGDLRAGHGRLNRRGNAGLGLVARGRCRAAGRPLLELDDDRRRGVVGRLLRRGSVGQGHSPGLGLADGQLRVLDSRPRLRVG